MNPKNFFTRTKKISIHLFSTWSNLQAWCKSNTKRIPFKLFQLALLAPVTLSLSPHVTEAYKYNMSYQQSRPSCDGRFTIGEKTMANAKWGNFDCDGYRWLVRLRLQWWWCNIQKHRCIAISIANKHWKRYYLIWHSYVHNGRFLRWR